MKLSLPCLALVLLAASSPAEARSVADCQLSWGKATRSYMNGKDTAAVDDALFKPACELEAEGKKEASRVEAVRVAAGALQKVDGDVCERFLKNFIGIEDAPAVCLAAVGEDAEGARKVITEALPPPSKGKPARKKGK